MADLVVLNRDQIMENYLRDFRSGVPDANTATNSDPWVRAKAIADVVLPIYSNALVIAKDVFPATASETALGRFGSTYGVPKLGEINASGTGVSTSNVPIIIADGSELTNPSTGVGYRTLGATVIGVGLSATTYVVALDPGVSGDADPGTILNYTNPPPGVSPIFTVESVAGGDSAWSNARWAKEILRRMRQAPRGGNIAHFIEIALTIPGIEQAFVYPALRGRGTMDLCITTSAASGSRVAGTATINRYFGALQGGAKSQGGGFIPGIPEDVLSNTQVHAAVAQPTNLLIGFSASAANPFGAWPPKGVGFSVPGDPTSWYKVTAAVSLVSFTVGLPAAGTAVGPTAGKIIGAFFPSVGFCKATILSVTGAGAWTVTTSSWVGSDNVAVPTELAAAFVGTVFVPWCSQLSLLAGAPVTGSLALSGAVPDFFAGLGPGEMTALTVSDTTRRRRWPRTTDTDPLTGTVEWPTNITARAQAAAIDATDAADLTLTTSAGVVTTPAVPSSAYIGTPPSILTVGTITVIPF